MASQKSLQEEGSFLESEPPQGSLGPIYLWSQVRQGGTGTQGSVREWCLIYDASNDGTTWQGGYT